MSSPINNTIANINVLIEKYFLTATFSECPRVISTLIIMEGLN